jgi:hypothetical protein
MQKLVNFQHREGHCFEFQIWKMENLEKNQKSGGAILPAAHASPWPRVPASTRPRVRGDAAVAWSPPATSPRSTARHVRSTHNPCSSRLHMCVVSLSPRIRHTGAEFPFASSPLPSLRRQPPSALPCRAAAPSTGATASDTVTPHVFKPHDYVNHVFMRL